ncbi:SGNH/GDSL hydrolase family protein [Bacillus sp. 4A_MP2]
MAEAIQPSPSPACSNPHVEVVDIYGVFEGHQSAYLSIDQFHPNHKGYEAMAEALFQQSAKQL